MTRNDECPWILGICWITLHNIALDCLKIMHVIKRIGVIHEELVVSLFKSKPRAPTVDLLLVQRKPINALQNKLFFWILIVSLIGVSMGGQKISCVLQVLKVTLYHVTIPVFPHHRRVRIWCLRFDVYRVRPILCPTITYPRNSGLTMLVVITTS